MERKNMDIITRPEAREKGLKIYFTGVQCKNKHVAYRYTQSGTCSACIRQSNGDNVDSISAERRQLRLQLVQIRCRLFDVDRTGFMLAAWGMVAMRYPILEPADVDPATLPLDRAANTGLYAVNCHLDDVAALRALANDLCRAHKLDIEAVRQKVLAGAVTYLPFDSAPPINFK